MVCKQITPSQSLLTLLLAAQVTVVVCRKITPSQSLLTLLLAAQVTSGLQKDDTVTESTDATACSTSDGNNENITNSMLTSYGLTHSSPYISNNYCNYKTSDLYVRSNYQPSDLYKDNIYQPCDLFGESSLCQPSTFCMESVFQSSIQHETSMQRISELLVSALKDINDEPSDSVSSFLLVGPAQHTEANCLNTDNFVET